MNFEMVAKIPSPFFWLKTVYVYTQTLIHITEEPQTKLGFKEQIRNGYAICFSKIS